MTAPDELALVEAWLERCDLVKYGGLRATSAQALQVLEEARALILTTTGVPAAVTVAA